MALQLMGMSLGRCPFRDLTIEPDVALSDSILDFESEDPDVPPEPGDLDTWDTEVEVSCPHCGEVVTIGVDPAGGAVQTYIEDCQVCCRPWQVHVTYDDYGGAHVWVEPA